MTKTISGNFFEDFRIGQTIRHATPRTVTTGDVAIYNGLFGARFAVQSSDAFAKAIGSQAWRDIQASLGYDRDFPITKDWHVGYYKGVFRGVPCYFLRHSRIEHIYTLDGKLGPSLAGDDE